MSAIAELPVVPNTFCYTCDKCNKTFSCKYEWKDLPICSSKCFDYTYGGIEHFDLDKYTQNKINRSYICVITNEPYVKIINDG
jgi:hypothetical protein